MPRIPLSRHDLRRIYKQILGREVLTLDDTRDYIIWLENHLVASEFDSIEGLEKIMDFTDECTWCDNLTYASKHGLCKNPECILYAFNSTNPR